MLVGDQVVRDVPETENYSLYWYQRDERGAHGTIDRYWVSKADGVAITPDMEYSVEGGKRVYNVTLADLPQYLPTSTDFSGSYNYVADLERSRPADDGTTLLAVVISRAALVARAIACVRADQARFATPAQRRLTYPNYAKEMPHLFA